MGVPQLDIGKGCSSAYGAARGHCVGAVGAPLLLSRAKQHVRRDGGISRQVPRGGAGCRHPGWWA